MTNFSKSKQYKINGPSVSLSFFLQFKMGFCIYCNYKVNTSATTCPKCYRTLTLANQQPPALPFSLEKRALNHTDKWQDT